MDKKIKKPLDDKCRLLSLLSVANAVCQFEIRNKMRWDSAKEIGLIQPKHVYEEKKSDSKVS